MQYPGLTSQARIDSARLKNRHVTRLIRTAYDATPQTGLESEDLERIGQMAGLTRSEVSRATIWSRTYESGIVGRLCGRVVLLVVLLILLMLMTTQAGFVEPLPTYAPGSRYAGVSPRDFH